MLNRTILKLLVVVILFVLLAWYFSSIFLYFVISAVIAAILGPIAQYIHQTQIFGNKIPRLFAIFVSYCILIIVITLFITLFIPLISDQVEILSSSNYDAIINKIIEPIRKIETFLIEYGMPDQEEDFLIDRIRNDATGFVAQVNFSNIVNTVISVAGKFFIGLMAILFISFFLMYQWTEIRRLWISWIPNSYFEVTITVINKIERLLSNYLLGLLIQMLIIFTLASVGLSIIGIEYALTIAAFAAVANLIPYFGPILGAVFGIVVSVSTGHVDFGSQDFFWLIFKVVSVFVGVQLIDNMGVQPFVFSKSVKAHPLEIFAVILAGATIAQIPGMIAAIPVYTILRVSAIELFHGYLKYRIFNNNV